MQRHYQMSMQVDQENKRVSRTAMPEGVKTVMQGRERDEGVPRNGARLVPAANVKRNAWRDSLCARVG